MGKNSGNTGKKIKVGEGGYPQKHSEMGRIEGRTIFQQVWM